MKINRVTISGADDKIDQKDLIDIQDSFPFVEWGILVSRKQMGKSRYPTTEWIKKLSTYLNVSFHLCGDIVREFVGGEHGVMWQQGIHWQRVQLNFSFKQDKNYLPHLLEISNTAARIPHRAIVLAYNNGSAATLDTFIRSHTSLPDNIHFLYDSSGGRGTEIKYFKKPLVNYTGYAGGISPENIFHTCDLLSNMEWQNNIWIDMETGVRTNDHLDLEKVCKVLSECEKFVLKDNPNDTQ